MKALITYDLEKMGWRKFISHDQAKNSNDLENMGYMKINGFDLLSVFDLK